MLLMIFQGQDETVRIVSMNKDFHVKCYACEVCSEQTSRSTTAVIQPVTVIQINPLAVGYTTFLSAQISLCMYPS